MQYVLTNRKTQSLHHRCLQAQAYLGIVQVISNHAYSYHEDRMHEDTYIAYACLCMHRRTSSVQCSDKVRFPQLRIKCGIAKSYPGTHTALQAPMVYIMGQLAANQMIKCYNNSITTCLIYLVAYTIKGKKERLCECRSLQ